ncbi:MAG TPA: LLM class flavin-dependent oxidoreductase, partial [Thermoanaerobaculia bacterium]
MRAHAGLCASLALRRSHHEHRLAVTGRSAEELRQALAESVAADIVTPGRRGKLAFVFSGQGTPWPGMGRDLLAQEPVFRAALEACDVVFRPLAGWSIVEALTRLESQRLEDTEIAQPVITAVQIALAALWRSWGIVPEAVVGHSVGEVAAACVAGALSVEQAMTLVHHRGRLMQAATGQGTMAAVRLAPGEIERLLDEHGRDGIAIAAMNSPASTVVSGSPLTLDGFLAALRARDVAVRPLDVRYAFHSGQMVRFEAELVERLDGFRPRAGALPVYSTLTGRLCAGEELTSAHWGRSLREPVLFAAAVDALIGDGFATFLEIGPHPALAGPLRQCLEHRGREGTVLASMRRDADVRMTMLGAAGALYAQGYEIDWTAIYPGDSAFTRFPSYPWQRERYWIESGIEETAKDESVGSVGSVDTGRPIDFSLMFFAASDGAGAEAQAAPGFDKYRLVLEAAKFADRHGFASVSVPERHFTGFGCLYPNPAVLHAAVARETKRVRLRAGSVVLPLHNPIRVAEEWSMVDNLSGGRVELSFASGWNPDDFILAPGSYRDRQAEMVRGIRTVRQLWRGEAV